jgi:hypothetical protein
LCYLFPTCCDDDLFISPIISISIDRKLTLDAQHRLEREMLVAGVGVADTNAEYFSYEK